MPKTLLLADDSVVIQKLVGLSFANEDVELTTTDNGDDAITKARELKPDLVLADVVMPGKNGYEVCETIKADPQLAHVPVLLLTGTFEAFDENRARSAGSDGHITKPFEAQALVDRVNELLAQAPAAPQLATTTPTLDGPAVTRIADMPPAENDDSFDFFEDASDPLAQVDASGEVASPPPLPASPSPLEPAAPVATPAADAGAPSAAASVLPPLSGADDAALMPDSPAAATPPIDDLAFDADDLTPPDPAATTVHLTDEAEPASAAGAAPTRDDDLLLGDEAATWNDDLEIGPEPIRSPAGDATQLSDDLFPDPPAAAAAPVDLDAAIAEDTGASAPASALVSDGDRSSDAIAFGEASAPAAPDPMKTMLADDLFSDAEPAAPETPAATPADLDLDPTSAPAENVASDFEVSSSDLETSIPAMPPLETDATADEPFSPPTPPTRTEPSASAPPEPVTSPKPEPIEIETSTDTTDDFQISDGLLAGAPPAHEPTDSSSALDAAPEALGTPQQALDATPQAIDTPPEALDATPQALDATPQALTPAPPDLGPDLTPIMRERVHETLERVAWEAFADLSDTIVKQVVEKVEQVAWEVIPQMAEAAIKEEIRRMKGENDE